MNILALDIATITGWATKTASGIWDLNVKKDESKGFRLIRLRSKLREIIDMEKIDVIVFERPAGFHKNPIIVQSELQSVVKVVCEDQGIEYRGFSATEIKKFATGGGRADKLEMVKLAKEKYGMQSDDNNEADALHLMHLALSFYDN